LIGELRVKGSAAKELILVWFNSALGLGRRRHLKGDQRQVIAESRSVNTFVFSVST